MLLNIDKVLKLVIEGKDIKKIAELANCDVSDVEKIVENARILLNKYEGVKTRKKVLIKKSAKHKNDNIPDSDIFQGAEFTAVPVEDMLIMYIAVSVKKNLSKIGILIQDKEDRQVGKVSFELIDVTDEKIALYNAIIRSINIALYFKCNNLKIRIDNETVYNELINKIDVKEKNILDIIQKLKPLVKKIKEYKYELVSKMLNDKAKFIANKETDSKNR